MTKTERAPAPTIERWGEYTIIWIDSENIDAHLEFLRENAVDGVGINAVRGYTASDVSFLERIPEVGGVVTVPGGRPLDASAILGLRKLRFLSLGETDFALDLDVFPGLEEYRGDCGPKFHISERSRSIRSLRLRHFRPKSRDLSDFPALPCVRELGLIQSSINSLRGLAQLRALERLELAYCRSLTTLAAPAWPRLQMLECSNCRALESYDALANVKTLRSLRLNSCGTIPSLQFISSLPELTELRFVDTDVRDGDMRPLFRLQEIAFTNKRGFSHTWQEVEREIAAKAGNGPM